MIKLIATDIDGTLLKDGTLMIDPEYMTVIEKLTSKGIIFVAHVIALQMSAFDENSGIVSAG